MTLLIQEERSKIMNSRAFSCGESAVLVAQQPGKEVPELVAGSPGNPTEAESLTCRPVYTKRPHWLSAGVPTGVLKLK